MRKYIIVLVFVATFLAAGNLPKITWSQAGQYVGQEAAVTGTIYKTHQTRKVCFINFAYNWRDTFSVVIFRNDWKHFRKVPCNYYHAGDTITAIGLIKWYKGKPEMIIHSGTNIINSGK